MVTRQVVVSFWIGLGLSAFFEPGFGGTVSLPPSLSLSGAVYLLFFRRLSPPSLSLSRAVYLLFFRRLSPPSLSLSRAVYLLFFRRLSPPCCLNAERCARGPEPGEGATAFHFSSSRCASTVATAF